MNREELLNSITEIGTCEDVNERRKMLDNLRDSIGKVYDEVDTLNEVTKNFKESNEQKDKQLAEAQKYNMELFLKLGEQVKSDNEVMESQTGVKKEEPKEYKSFEDLSSNYMK